MASWLKTPPKLKQGTKRVSKEEKGEGDGDDEGGPESKFAECPVCGKSIYKASINSHVDACLSGNTNDTPKSSIHSGDRNPNEFTQCSSCKGNILNATYEAHVELCKASGNKRKRFSDNEQPSFPLQSSQPSQPSHPRSPQSSLPSPPSTHPTSPQKPSQKFSKGKWAPLSERLRPSELGEVLGQDQLLGDKAILKLLIQRDAVPSMILWGPPGCGKTTIARIIAGHTKMHFVSLSAVTAGVNDVKKAVTDAQALCNLTRQRTILFLDEIHRFNKLQQDVFLPFVENGTITLIGATTENPSFQVNSALLSRCKVFVLQKLQSNHINQILLNAVQRYNSQNTSEASANKKPTLTVDDEVLEALSESADGDARMALNVLELAVEASRKENGDIHITAQEITGAMQKTHLLYDKKSDQHYNVISALHKSMRGNDPDAALYWLGRMLEGGEEPLYIARRLIRFASEDVGLADPNALVQAVAAFQASHMIGMPECDVILAQCVAYLARAPKSIAVYKAYNLVKECIRNEPTPPVPLHISNAPTKLMEQLGYAKGYKYTPDYADPKDAQQDYLPESLKNRKFLDFKG